MKTSLALGAALLALAGLTARAQHPHDDHLQNRGAQEQGPTDMEDATAAMGRGEHGHGMGPHMKMSTLRAATPQDSARAQEIVRTARAALDRYQDVTIAEADGFRKFLPGVKQKMYHYTSLRNAFDASFGFDAGRPTSLLYEPDAKGQMKLIGAMYTAPGRLREEQLDARVPLSIAQWHQHVNMCVPPAAQHDEMFRPRARFGLNGSITTAAECAAAGGTFRPRVFGWMVHLYPYEKTTDAMWSVERQKDLIVPTASPPPNAH